MSKKIKKIITLVFSFVMISSNGLIAFADSKDISTDLPLTVEQEVAIPLDNNDTKNISSPVSDKEIEIMRANDTKTERRMYTGPYEGRYTINGKTYNYSLQVRVIYYCDIHIPTNTATITSIDSINSFAGGVTVFRTYTQQDARVDSINRATARVSGYGTWSTPLSDIVGTHVETPFKLQFNANDGRKY